MPNTAIKSFKKGVGHLGATDKKMLDALNDTERFSPAWFERLLDGYTEERDKTHKESWDMAYEFYDPASCLRGIGGMSGVAYRDGYWDLMHIHPARVRNMIQSGEAMVLNTHPKILVNPLTPKMQRLAPIFETAANAEWQRDRQLMDALRMAYRECWLTGFAFILNGYTSQNFKREMRNRKHREKFAESLLMNPMADSVAEVVAAQELYGEDSIDLDEREATFEQDDVWVKDSICSKFVPSDLIVFDTEAGSLHEASWIGRAILADHEAVKRDPNLSHTDNLPTMMVKDVQDAKTGMSTLGVPSKITNIDGPFRYVCLYEIFHRNDDDGWDMLVMAKGQKEPLREEKNVYALGQPYSLLSWNRQGRSLFTASDFGDIKSLILAERKCLKRLHEGVMRNLEDGYILDKSVFPKHNEIEWITEEGVGKVGFAETAHTSKPLQSGIAKFERTQISGEVMNYLAVIDKHFQIASGLGPNQIGMPMRSETSATESKNVDDWVRLRGGVKYAAMEDFVADIAHKRCQLMAEFYDYDRIGTLAGPEAAGIWAKENFTDGDIQSGLMVKVEQGSMQPQNDEQRASFAAEVLGLLKDPVLGPVLAGNVNIPGILRMWAKSRGIMDGSDIILNISQKDVSEAATKMALMKQMSTGTTGSAPPEAMGASLTEPSLSAPTPT